MKTALVTTTINLPTVLRLYRKLGPQVEFFIAGDLKSPHAAIQTLCGELGYARYLHPDEQKKWKCSEPIGWNCIQRRNVATLEALQWGADIIYSCDTDDFPFPGHFENVERILSVPFSGIELRANSSWVDPGWMVEPPVSHRGMPVRLDRFYCHPTVGRYVAVVAATVLGSCDISAMDRLVGFTKRQFSTDLAAAGVVVDPSVSKTLFNSEAVAFIRDVVPACMVLPHVGRYDDLFMSLVAQRVMGEWNLCVSLGRPIVWHERADRDLITDLEQEIYGMRAIARVVEWLDGVQLPGGTITEQVRSLWETVGCLPHDTHMAALAWLEDCESVL